MHCNSNITLRTPEVKYTTIINSKTIKNTSQNLIDFYLITQSLFFINIVGEHFGVPRPEINI